MTYNILDFGAVSSMDEISTKAIQEAIDTCSGNGGGRVLVPAGNYVMGTIYLKDNVDVHIEDGATLWGSINSWDYDYISREDLCSLDFSGPTGDTKTELDLDEKDHPRMLVALIAAEGVKHCGFSGRGTINGRGKTGHYIPFTDGSMKPRPYMFVSYKSEDVWLENIHMVDPGFWTTDFSQTNLIRIHGVNIYSWDTNNGDGLDFDSSTNVTISDCIIKSADDAISLKAQEDYPAYNYTITNCIIEARWAAFRLGTDIINETYNVTMSNCVFQHCVDGLKLQASGGARFHDMWFSNIVMEDCHRPVFTTLSRFRLSKFNDSVRPTIGYIDNLNLSNITCKMPADGEVLFQNFFSINGVPEKNIGRFTISNCLIEYEGRGTEKDALRSDVPEFIDYGQYYAEAFQLKGELPTCGIYARHIDDLRLRDVTVRVRNKDVRPAYYLYDIGELKMYNCDAYGEIGNLVTTVDCDDIIMRDCRLNKKPVDAPASVPAEMYDRIKAFAEKTWKTHLEFERLSKISDAAEKARPVKKLPISEWIKDDNSLSVKTLIPEGTKFINFTKLYGNCTIFIDGDEIGKLDIPKIYRTSTMVAFEIPQDKTGKDAEIKLVWEDPSDKGGLTAKMYFGDDFTMLDVGVYCDPILRG